MANTELELLEGGVASEEGAHAGTLHGLVFYAAPFLLAAGDGFAVAILNRNEPAFYCVPARAYEALMDKIEDLELNALADMRAHEKVIKVSLNDL